ncbi:hypothetical protein MCM47_38515 [Kitasatospora sp. A2-31]|nr:hypothetical protein [Kitasatospora sp. A2-31]
MQPQGLLHRGDHRAPFGLVGEVAGVLEHAVGGDLLATDSGEQALALDVDAGIDERGGDVLREVLQMVGQVLAGGRGHVDVVDLVDQHQVALRIDQGLADRVGDVHLVVPRLQRPIKEVRETGRELARGTVGRGGEQPERLRGKPGDLRVEVQQHRVVPLQLRLAGQLTASGRAPVVPGHRSLAGVRPHRAYRSSPLEPRRPARRQRLPPPHQLLIDERDDELRWLHHPDIHRSPLALAARHWAPL